MSHVDNFGQRLKQARLRHGLTQASLGLEWGRSRGAIARYEDGTSYPEVDLVIQFCERYQESADWLLLGRLDPPPSATAIAAPGQVTQVQAAGVYEGVDVDPAGEEREKAFLARAWMIGSVLAESGHPVTLGDLKKTIAEDEGNLEADLLVLSGLGLVEQAEGGYVVPPGDLRLRSQHTGEIQDHARLAQQRLREVVLPSALMGRGTLATYTLTVEAPRGRDVCLSILEWLRTYMAQAGETAGTQLVNVIVGLSYEEP